MAGPAFDPKGAVRFDLERGVASDLRGARLVVFPAAAVDALEKVNAGAVAALGVALGHTCGKNVASRLGGDGGVRGSQLEVVLSHLGGELALAGVGTLHVERWGRAMICVLGHAAVASEIFLSAALGSALSAASGRDVACALVGRNGANMRFFVGTSKTVERARALVAQGKPFGDIVATIEGGAS